MTFSCIWLALAVFSLEGLYHQGRVRRLQSA
jgi:hypothetical protein